MVATGPHTAFGAIAERLADRPEETEFQRGLRRFGLLITRTVFFLVLFILVVRIAMHKDAFESFVFAIALAVGLTPEFLPMITSVTLGRGAIRMARNHVIVKHLPAIQNFGTIDVFCSDKTGTLTTGEVILDSSVDYLGNPSDRPLALAYVNSKFETGIRSPLEVAILKSDRQDADAYLKCDEVPFDFERRRLSMDRHHTLGADRAGFVDGIPGHIHQAAQRNLAYRNRDGGAGVDDLHAALHAIGARHGDRADLVAADVLLHLDGHAHVHAGIRGRVDLEGVVQLGQMAGLELDVEHRADDLNDLADCV